MKTNTVVENVRKNHFGVGDFEDERKENVILTELVLRTGYKNDEILTSRYSTLLEKYDFLT